MRIIGGRFRSLQLKMVPSKNTRETSDMVRGAVMNSLGNRVVDSCVLDLFAGSGAYGLEALSRGAKHVVLNDFAREAVNTIKENVRHLKVENQVTIWSFDYLKALQKIHEENIRFDLVFIDPPYEMSVYEDVIYNLLDLLNENGIVVIEMHKNKNLSLERLNDVNIYKTSTYGIKKVVYLEKVSQD